MLIDTQLVQRVEYTLAQDAGALAPTLAALAPELRSNSAPLADGQMVLLGAGMFVNRAMGIGLGREVSDNDLDVLEASSFALGVPSEVQVCPWADNSLLQRLATRAYRLAWFRSALAQPLPTAVAKDRTQAQLSIIIRTVDDDLLATWQTVAAAGFRYTDIEMRRVSDLHSAAAHRADGQSLFVAYINDEPVGVAAMALRDNMATLGGMTTIPTARRLGVQAALIRHRLALAARAGCDFAVSTATPGTGSERNLLRHGFQLLYTQVGMQRAQRDTASA